MHAAYGQRLAKPAVARRRDVEWHSGCSQRLEAAREYGCAIATAPIPILASCHKEDVQMIDRMILKGAARGSGRCCSPITIRMAG